MHSLNYRDYTFPKPLIWYCSYQDHEGIWLLNIQDLFLPSLATVFHFFGSRLSSSSNFLSLRFHVALFSPNPSSSLFQSFFHKLLFLPSLSAGYSPLLCPKSTFFFFFFLLLWSHLWLNLLYGSVPNLRHLDHSPELCGPATCPFVWPKKL